MKAIRTSIILAVALVLLPTSCRLKKCAFSLCTECQMVQDDCSCLDNSRDFHCPTGTMHGSYNYGSFNSFPCQCVCETGWTGEKCDQRDTTYSISLRYGFDTMLLSGTITTSYYSRIGDSSENRIEGHFPDDAMIDSIKIRGSLLPRSQFDINTFFQQGYLSSPVCRTDSACVEVEVKFKNGGTIAFSDTGTMTFDTTWKEYFNVNLTIPGTGQDFYIRDGVLRLPLDFLVL